MRSANRNVMLQKLRPKTRSEERIEALKMTDSKKSKLVIFHQECCTQMHQTMKNKNADYTGAADDPFRNFRRHGAMGFLVRMNDKLARLESFVEKGTYAVKDESVLDTCLDLANYAVLLAAYLKEEKDVTNGVESFTG